MDRQSHEYMIEIDSELPFSIVRYRPVLLDEGEVFSVPLRVSIPKETLNDVTAEISFIVRAIDNSDIFAQESATFIGPAGQ
jgi:hypothetical protein